MVPGDSGKPELANHCHGLLRDYLASMYRDQRRANNPVAAVAQMNLLDARITFFPSANAPAGPLGRQKQWLPVLLRGKVRPVSPRTVLATVSAPTVAGCYDGRELLRTVGGSLQT
jgi:hypothetical protein